MTTETDQKLQKLNKEIDKITDKCGMFAEYMVSPAIVKFFKERGISITDYSQRSWSEKWKIEYDIVAFSKEYVVVSLVRMELQVSDVKEFLNERLPIFKEVFPRYKDMKVIGAVAGATILEKSDVYAIKCGLYVLAQSGENITMLNDDTFKAKVF